MFCSDCGARFNDNYKYCPYCGVLLEYDIVEADIFKPFTPAEPKPQVERKDYKNYMVSKPAEKTHRGVTQTRSHQKEEKTPTCPKCGGRMQIQTVSESRKAGCLTILLYVLLAVSLLGLFILIPLMLRKKTETVTYAVCQSCGFKKRI